MEHLSLNTRFATEEGALEQFLQRKQADALLELVSHECGADREQWLIRFENQLYIIFVEQLSESAWLEPMQQQGEQDGENYLAKLSKIFN